jgi:hypothetical protein
MTGFFVTGLLFGRLPHSLRRLGRGAGRRACPSRKGEERHNRRSSIKAAARLRPAPGEALVAPLASAFGRWMPEEAVVVTAVTSEAGTPLNLALLALPTGGERVRNLRAGHGVHVPLAIRLTPGDVLRLPHGACAIELLSEPHAGLVRIEAAGQPPVFADLHDVTPRRVRFPIPGTADAPRRRHVSARKLRLAAFEAELDSRIVIAMAATARSKAQAATLAIYSPRRHDAAQTTADLFDRALPLPGDDGHPEDLTGTEIELCAARLAELPIDRLVMAGSDPAMLRLIEAVRRRRRLDVDLLWHGSYLDMGEPEDWRLLSMWLDAARGGVIRRVGAVRKGFDGFLRAFGFDARYVQNRIPLNPAVLRPPTARDTVGIWLSKSRRSGDLPYSSLCALADLPDVTVTGAGFDDRALALAEELGIRARDLRSQPLAPDDLKPAVRETALTLSVATSEYVPGLSLESLGQGVPCLIGPSCPLFLDDPDLRALYVAERSEQPAYLAGKIRELLRGTDDCFPRLMAYVAAWNVTSAASVEAFLDHAATAR